MIAVVMGVAGSGKSTVGRALAKRLGARFLDADTLHSAQNVAQMAGGIPLDDVARGPWLARLAEALSAAERAGEDLVVASSALKRAYRDLFRRAVPDVRFVHLDAGEARLRERLLGRLGHFMPASLLQSQLEALEPLGQDEHALVLDATATPTKLAAAAADWLRTGRLESQPRAH